MDGTSKAAAAKNALDLRLSLRATLNLRLAALEAKLAAKLEAKLKVISIAHEIRILDFLKKQI